MGNLILGWKVNDKYDPLPFAEKGLEHSSFSDYEENLFKISPEKLGNHTAIIAQSGSGKSFFLGRLLEEIILRSNIECFVIDPNADYRNFHLLNENIWENKRNSSNNLFRLTNEVSSLKNEREKSESQRKEFEENWRDNIESKIKNICGEIDAIELPYEKIKMYWPELSSETFISSLGIVEQTEYRLLNYLVQLVGQVSWIFFLGGKEIDVDPVDFVLNTLREILETLALYERTSRSYSKGENGLLHDKLSQHLEEELHFSELKSALDRINEEPELIYNLPQVLIGPILNNKDFDVLTYYQNRFDKTQLISKDTLTFFENKYRELSITEIFSPNPLERTKLNKQLCICDLPSFDNKETRLTVIGHLLDDIWQQARFEWSMVMSGRVTKDNRKPRIIVIDEAHNLVPIATENRCEDYIREKIRTIAAEGRKYGLFLLLISQRPDKLDLKVLSECKNVGVMRINNQFTIDNIGNIFGLEDYKDSLQKARELDTGRMMMFGDWAEEQGTVFFAAARRTKEGGKKIPDENYQK